MKVTKGKNGAFGEWKHKAATCREGKCRGAEALLANRATRLQQNRAVRHVRTIPRIPVALHPKTAFKTTDPATLLTSNSVLGTACLFSYELIDISEFAS